MSVYLKQRCKHSGGTAVTSYLFTTQECDVTLVSCTLDPAAGAARYIMLFDKATPPVLNDVPLWREQVDVGKTVDFRILGEELMNLDNGGVVAISTTAGTYTPAPAEAYYTVLYEGHL